MLITRRAIRQMTDHELRELVGELYCRWAFDDGLDQVLPVHLSMSLSEVNRRRRRRIMRGRCTCEPCMNALAAMEQA